MARRFVGLLILVLATSFGGALYSQTALTIVSADDETEWALTLEDLRDMTQTELSTSNEFVDGEKLFRGPLMREVLMQFAGRKSDKVWLTAANDYQVEVATSEFYDYDVILALSMGGVALSKRDKGPIWVIYPMSDFAELRDPVYNSHLIWQLVKVEYQ